MNKKYIYIVFFIIISLLFTKGYYFYSQEKEVICSTEILPKDVEGDSMYPLIENGSKINLELDYYNSCSKEILRGDIVAYNYGGDKRALIKQVKVIDTDLVSFSGANLIVNGSYLVNSVGEKYYFNAGEINMISLYINNGKIPKESYLLFGDNISASIDSRKFGAISRKDILGRFDIKSLH